MGNNEEMRRLVNALIERFERIESEVDLLKQLTVKLDITQQFIMRTLPKSKINNEKGIGKWYREIITALVGIISVVVTTLITQKVFG